MRSLQSLKRQARRGKGGLTEKVGGLCKLSLKFSPTLLSNYFPKMESILSIVVLIQAGERAAAASKQGAVKQKILSSRNPFVWLTYKTSGTACWAVQGPGERIEETEGPQQCGELCDACFMGLSH